MKYPAQVDEAQEFFGRQRDGALGQNVKTRTIEVDSRTADLLEARARGRGMNVSELIADMACNEEGLPADLANMRAKGEGPWSPTALEEDARRLAAFERARMGSPWDEVKTWMESWGAFDELPVPKLRRV